MCATGVHELDVAHALAANDGARDFDAALLADDALVADAAVFAAVTFVVASQDRRSFRRRDRAFRSAGCGS